MALQFISLLKSFKFKKNKKISSWISKVIYSKNYIIGDINVIFCNDNYLLDLNINYLNHKTLTDIITFEYNEFDLCSGDLYISIDRVKYNAEKFNVSFENELNRVIVHGILHLCGYKDKRRNEEILMRKQEYFQLQKLNKI